MRKKNIPEEIKEIASPNIEESKKIFDYFHHTYPNSTWKYNSNGITNSFHSIFTPIPFARLNLIYPEFIVLDYTSPAHYYMRRKNFHSFQIQYTISGHGVLIYKDNRYDLLPGDCFFIDCNNEHCFYTEGNETWTHHGMQLNGHQLKAINELYYKYNGVKVHPLKSENILKLFDKIALSSRSKFANSALIQNELLTELLTELLLCSQIISKEQISNKVSGIIKYIENNFQSIQCIDEIADACFISKYHMCREFKIETGKTIMEYLTEIRINIAKGLLLTTNMSISEIAYNTGFHSVSYFYSVFKKYDKITPLEYRKNSIANI
jgi:AraC-like DNA-binding protein